MRSNPATATGQMADSLPPAIMALAHPRRMISLASPIECVPAAQAVTIEKFGPFKP